MHARGAAAHGYFQVYKSLCQYSKAQFLADPGAKTPVFVRFSTVGGSRGSADTARDVRGFAVKFSTQEGNFDLVGNNMPVFFIQDAIKFPDFVHAVRPEPNREIPQASSAHDTLYDFVSLTPESTHMMMWLMSDRAIPRSYRMMEGFGVHTFRLNAQGVSHFVKALEAAARLTLSGVGRSAEDRGPRPRLSPARPLGRYRRWRLPRMGARVANITEAQAGKFGFDVLDATKLVPEELVPVQRVGKMTLNRNPDNYFAEAEQVAFCTTHLVPGIDFSDDPLLQGRNFSYLDTQLSRLGSPNFNDIPINRPVCPFSNNQVQIREVRERMVGNLALVDATLAQRVAEELGFTANAHAGVNNGTPKGATHASPSLSILNSPKKPSIATRKIAILAANGVNIEDAEAVGKALQGQGAKVAVLSLGLRPLAGANGGTLAVDYRIVAGPSVVWDAVFIPGGAQSFKTLAQSGAAMLFVREQYKHAKPICAFGDGVALLESAGIHGRDPAAAEALGVIVGNAASAKNGAAAKFATAIAHGRFFNRSDVDAMPA